MRRKAFICLLVCLLLLPGCVPQPEPTVPIPTPPATIPITTEPTQTTELPESTTTPEEPSIYKAPPEGSVPILLYTAKGEDEAVANYLTWDVANGTFSESVPWYTVSRDTFLDPIVELWNGGPFVAVSGEPIDSETGIQVSKRKTEKLHIVYGSLCDINNSDQFTWYNMDGSKILYDRPSLDVPDEICNSALPLEAYYATVDEGNIIAVYSVYDFDTLESDIVYVTYPVDNPDAAVWKVVHLPLKYAMDVDANWNGAYWDGVLYMAALDTVVALDLETGTWEALDAFDRIHALTPEATQYEMDGTLETVRLVGCWDGILVAAYPQYLPDETFHYYYVALQDGELLGFIDKHFGEFTFYDSDLQVIGTNNEYAETIISLGLYFAKQS